MTKREWLAFPVYCLAEICGILGHFAEVKLDRLALRIAGPRKRAVANVDGGTDKA